jgi:ER membrane protein SH3
MRVLACAGAGFLLAVLWFDLMFDVQVRGHRTGELPEAVLSSIAGYYARVTTAARPMNRLVGIVMLATLGALIAELYGDELPVWRATASLALTFAAIALAAGHTVPSAIRLGTRRDDIAKQSHLARVILRDHVLCIVAIVGVLILQLLPA